MPAFRTVVAGAVLVALGGCASKGDLRRVEEQLLLSRGENQRADSARAAELSQILGLQRRIMDSLNGVGNGLDGLERQLQGLRGDVSNDLISVQQQLVQIQALTGQSQQRLTELQTQLEARSEQLNTPAPIPADTAAIAPGASGPPPAGSPSAEQVYAASLQQLRRGSPATARMGFRELLRLYPTHERVPDATYFLGESFAAESPDSAAVFYAKVAADFPRSLRAASAVYKLGLLAERKKDVAAARGYFTTVVRDYPRSDEAALARDRLKTLGR